MSEPLLPVAPLMTEHRLAQRMMGVIRWRVADMESTGAADIGFIDAAVDFMRTYADRCHHGKEESILFRELARKPLSAEHRGMIDELVAEHVFARTTTGRLVEARNRYAAGEASAHADITACLHMFVEFYPKHIAKEEQGFFAAAMRYFTAEEQRQMLAEETDFDRQFVHVMYGEAVGRWEQMQEVGRKP